MIGLGLDDKEDISVKALNIVRNCDYVYLEHYTSKFFSDISDLEDYYGKKIIIADRNLVESQADSTIVKNAVDSEVAFLVVGDVFSATTHTDLLLRAKEIDVDVKYYPNASIMNAIGIVGLELYKFGKTTSIPYPTGDFVYETPYDVIKQNQSMGLHTLCLLDIKMAESSPENIRKGIDKPEPPRFMSVKEALKVLLKIENKRGENLINKETKVIGLARVGSDSYIIKSGSLGVIEKEDFGGPLHSLIVPGKLHVVEEEALELWNVNE